ncbi:MAG TPA: efflux RND transporter periplasmic adaptor subunit [Verrucomicrobiae bacterium]
MKTTVQFGVSLAALVVVGATAGLVRHGGATAAAARAERKVLFYQDSMHPWIKSDRPGKCTVCEMDLTPIYEGQAGFGSDANLVVINSNQVTVLNVQAEPVKRRSLSRALRVAGTLDANETSKTIISAPARGRIDFLAVDYAGVEVEQGQKLVTMFSPELVQLRKTLLAVRDAAQPGMTNSQTKSLVDAGVYTGDILAPQSGMVLERNVYKGQYVAEGDRMLTIADASLLWFRFDVYQNQLPWFDLGQTIEVEVSGIPGKVFPAVISFIEPSFNDTTRTVKVRADVRNPLVDVNGHKRRLLRYGMYAEGHVKAEIPQVLAAPRTAILFPGGAAYAYVDKGAGAYERRRLKLGRQGDDFWEVIKGLDEGDSVVTSGNMLIDAQAQFNLTSQPDETEVEEAVVAEPVPLVAREENVPPRHAMTGGGTEAMRMSEKPPVMTTAMVTQSPAPAAAPAQPLPAREHAAARRTARMSAVMSPGGEVQLIRRAAILAELAQKATNAPQPAPASALTPAAVPEPPAHEVQTQPPPAPATGALAMSPEPAAQVAAPQPVQAAADKPLTHSQADVVRRAAVTEARGVRRAAIIEANKQQTSGAAPLSAVQRGSLQAFLAEAGGVSQALAADNLESFNGHIAKLPALAQPLTNAFPATIGFRPLLERLAAFKWQTAKDLADARKQFLPFSTTVVDLVKQLRKQDDVFAAIKIYHCPMAPEPGLWIQSKAPLANAFYGSKMLRCGEEVTP